jgi:hypothetical protein
MRQSKRLGNVRPLLRIPTDGWMLCSATLRKRSKPGGRENREHKASDCNCEHRHLQTRRCARSQEFIAGRKMVEESAEACCTRPVLA